MDQLAITRTTIELMRGRRCMTTFRTQTSNLTATGARHCGSVSACRAFSDAKIAGNRTPFGTLTRRPQRVVERAGAGESLFPDTACRTAPAFQFSVGGVPAHYRSVSK